MAKMIIGVEDKPRPSQLISSVIQQLLANIASTITVPLVIGLSSHIASAILGCGIGTLAYQIITKRKSPVLLSSNFAFIGALAMTYANTGFLGIVLGGFLTGLVYIILSLIVKRVGTKWIDKFFPPVIIGPVVALIGLGLSATAVADLIKVDGYFYFNDYEGITYPYNLVGLGIGLITFFVIVVCTIQNRSKTISMLPFLFGVGSGYLIALVLTLIGNAIGNTYIKVIDFSPITSIFEEISIESFLSLPRLALVDGISEIVNGEVLLDGMSVLQIVLAFVPISLVSFSEHIADHKNLSTIIERDLINEEPGLHRTLLGDGVGSMLGTWFGICPNTTYGEAISCVAITKNASTWTIIATAFTCIALSFFTPLIAAFRTIPPCIIGGMCLALFGYIAVSGLRMLKHVDFENNKNIFTVSVIFVAGIGGLCLKIPYQLGLIEGSDLYGMVEWVEITSIAFALILGLITYSLCGFIEKHNIKEEVNNKGE